MQKKIKVIWSLDILQLGIALFSLSAYDEIYYLNISKFIKRMLNFFGLGRYLMYLDFTMYKIGDKRTGSYISQLTDSVVKACDTIVDRVLKINPFIISFGKLFDRNRVPIFFRKIIYREVEEAMTYLIAVKWHNEQDKGEVCDIDFLVNKSPFFNVLKEIAAQEYRINMQPTIYIGNILRHLYIFCGNLFLMVAEALGTVIKSCTTKKKHKKSIDTPPLVGTMYTKSGLHFDLVHRCDFPWFLITDIPPEQILIYFDKSYKPSEEDVSAISTEQRAVRYISTFYDRKLSKIIPVHYPTARFAKTGFFFMVKTFLFIFRDLLKGRFDSLYYLNNAVKFVRIYAKAYDFYYVNDIKVNVDRTDHDPYQIPKQVALRHIGGVSVSAQLSCWPMSDVSSGPSADVMFLFSRYYLSHFLKSGSCSEIFLFSGYLTDYSFSAVQDRSRKLRDMLMSNGAEFIICYFDENSSEGRMKGIPNKRSAYVYKKLFDWVMFDKTLGLICSPKRPKTLAARLPDIQFLMKEAIETGRCIFMDGPKHTSNYPTEPAQAADIVISLLIGGTAAFESYLSNKRVVYLDLERLYSYPEYQWGKDKIVFDDLEALIAAIKGYRQHKETYDDLWNKIIVPVISEKDTFRDGRAAERMGEYLKWLLEKFSEKKTRKEALEYATRRYAEKWRDQNVVRNIN